MTWWITCSGQDSVVVGRDGTLGGTLSPISSNKSFQKHQSFYLNEIARL
jgi:hypothetical protein